MIDYRLPGARQTYFSQLYKMNLEQGVMPGLVYLYMPKLAEHFNWDAEEKLWFAFLNGMTQNPITSLRMFSWLSKVPPAGAKLISFTEWFNENWDILQFDTDRRYQKKDTVDAIKAYATVVEEYGSQEAMLSNKPYSELWNIVRTKYHSFGRLSSFSYLEYVNIMGFGADCDNLLFDDKSGSKSHRNGMLFLSNLDDMVWDKRMPEGHDGAYVNFKVMCSWLEKEAETFLFNFKESNPTVKNVGNFTMESNLCTFKNHFFGRRYPGVYADMAQERIQWADERNLQSYTEVFKKIREDNLPEWLRSECEKEHFTLKEKAAIFPTTGIPYRAEYFIT